MSEWLRESPLSLRQLGFLTGGLLVLDGFVGGIIHLVNLQFTQLLINMAAFATGSCAMMIEYKDPKLPATVKRLLVDDALFLFHPFGRPLIYLLWGVLIASSGGISTPLGVEAAAVGCCITCASLIAIAHTITAKEDAEKLKHAHLKREVLAQAFNSSDENKNGQLSSLEFFTFLKKIDMQLSYDSLGAILLEVDASHNEEVSFEEFMLWYERKDEEFHV